MRVLVVIVMLDLVSAWLAQAHDVNIPIGGTKLAIKTIGDPANR